MKKLLVFGVTVLGLSLVSQAAWVSPKLAASVEQSKSLSVLADLSGGQSLGSPVAKGLSSGAKDLSLVGLGEVSKSTVTKWKDVGVSQSFGAIETDLVFAKNEIVPEASTWMAGAVVAAMLALRLRRAPEVN